MPNKNQVDSVTCGVCTLRIEDGPVNTCRICANTFCMNCGEGVEGKDMCNFCMMRLGKKNDFKY